MFPTKSFLQNFSMTVPYTEILVLGALLLLPFLYESSHAFRYFLKFSLCYGVVMINSVLLIPFFAFRPKSVHNLIVASYFCRWVTNLLGVRWILKGGEKLKPQEACIIVSNHQSSLDIMGMFNIWTTMGKCTVIAKDQLVYAGPFGLAAWLSGLVFIPRINTYRAVKIMNEAVDRIKLDGTKLWIFPEGTRRNTGQIHLFKKGAFHLAINSQLPILPVVFSRYYFLDKASKRFDQGIVVIKALDPIDTKGLTMNNLDNLMENVRDKMTVGFREVNKDVQEYVNKSSTISGNSHMKLQ